MRRTLFSSTIFLLLLVVPFVLSQNGTEFAEDEEETTEEIYDEAEFNATEAVVENGTTYIDVNITETPPANITETTSSPNTTLNGTYLSATPVPTTTSTIPPIHFPERAVGQWFCACDLQVGVCDANCCCDRDCSRFDLTAFPWCDRVKEHPEEKCKTNGFLCIFKDNAPERLWLKNPKISQTIKEFDSLAAIAPKWSWPEQEALTSKPKFYATRKYKAGDVIWSTRDNKTIETFALPLIGRQCFQNKTVRYLNDISNSCATNKNNKILLSDYFKGLALLADTSVPIENQTESWVQVKQYICINDSIENCTENASNVKVQRILFHIFHNGTQGIASAKLYMWKADEEADTVRNIQMNARITFLWNDVQPPARVRSGSPGYVPGLPILTGILSNNRTTVIALGHFNLASADSSGKCDQKKKLLFGEDILMTCDMPLNWTSCIAADATATLAGRYLNSVVGAFGDSEEGTLNDWMSILVKEQPPNVPTNCQMAPTNLVIQILWAKVGAVQRPQNKIVGMMISFGGHRVLTGVSARLTTSVTFKEVTTGLKGLFAPPPKYEIRLPSDFFYPLFSAVGVKQANMLILCFSAVFTFKLI
ncbi:tectonic-3 isoform X2 [Neocloeon triangulifer]|uniref:tectonic-3 isoform X2 n=1 Tax=Neocloeon triangulifer TaxID=2078957 RepID=UPI00286F080F|nr:tectonic-3 isoform X2 [Neocloeon triangulifer]